MQINIFGEHFEVSNAIEAYINKKFLHLHSPEKITHIEFRIGSTKKDKYVHFHANIPGESLIIKSTDKNLYHAIDNIMNKIQLCFIKEKGKHNQKLSIHN